MKRTLSCWTIAAGVATSIGCTTQSAPVAGPSAGSSTTAAEVAAPAEIAAPASPEVTLAVVDKAGYEETLKKYRGNVVLVDVWATWCAPCKKWFPNTVRMHEDYSKQGLAVISLSLDGEDEAAAALEFLKEQNATFTNLRSQYGAEPEGVEAFDIDGGAIPHFKLYDRAGNLARKFATGDAGPPNHAEIEKAVEDLLKKQ